jgi:hypothetical protein
VNIAVLESGHGWILLLGKVNGSQKRLEEPSPEEFYIVEHIIMKPTHPGSDKQISGFAAC